MSTVDLSHLVDALTLEEKASLCSGEGLWETKAVRRDGHEIVPALVLADGPHGVRRPARLDRVGIGESIPATCFPTASALGSSWDPELCREVGGALGAEARALGVAMLLGPGINIKRSPLCGRNFEYLSEDPVLTGVLGAAFVAGVQSRGVGACVKHFAVNNQETDRMRVSAEVDDRTLREVYLAGFERVVTGAAPWSVMCSYNRVNGVYASENRWLLTEVLREGWGFDGVVVSDWGAVADRVRGLAAGLDLEMPGTGGVTDAEIAAAVAAGSLDPGVLDRAAGRLLALVARALGQRPPPTAPDLAAHHALARRAAAECAVLLKNDGGILPLAPAGAGTVAVVGQLARTPRYQGAGSSRVVPTTLEVPLDEMRRLAGPGTDIRFAPGYGEGEAPVRQARAEAVALARAAGTVVAFLGLPAGMESEGLDRSHIDLPVEQVALLEALAAVNERIVVVLANGGVVSVAPWIDQAAAVLEGWLPGQAGGGAIADVLFGVAGPGGRLAETIPRRLEDTPSYLNFPGELGAVRYGEGLFVGYRGYDARGLDVAFPFGHGLAYTTFEYDALEVEVRGQGRDVAVDASLSVTNTGARPGREVVQLYVSDPVASVARPDRELKAFAKISLVPGGSERVTLRIGARDLSYFHPVLGRWVLEGGTFGLHVGASSRDIRLDTTVHVDGDVIALPLSEESTLAECLAHPVAGRLFVDALRAHRGGTASTPEAGPEADPAMAAMLMAMPIGKLLRFPDPPIPADELRDLLDRVRRREDGDRRPGPVP